MNQAVLANEGIYKCKVLRVTRWSHPCFRICYRTELDVTCEDHAC